MYPTIDAGMKENAIMMNSVLASARVLLTTFSKNPPSGKGNDEVVIEDAPPDAAFLSASLARLVYTGTAWRAVVLMMIELVTPE